MMIMEQREPRGEEKPMGVREFALDALKIYAAGILTRKIAVTLWMNTIIERSLPLR